MTDEMKFFLFLIERYANYKGQSTGQVMREWDRHHITEEIYDNYEMYHQECLENAYQDIDSLLVTGKHAW